MVHSWLVLPNLAHENIMGYMYSDRYRALFMVQQVM